MRHVPVHHRGSHVRLVTSSRVYVCLGVGACPRDDHRNIVYGASMDVSGGEVEQPLQSREAAAAG